MARLISKQEAARLLDVTTQTISNWLERGYIKGHIVDKYLMIDKDTIEQYFDKLQDMERLEKAVEEKTEYLQNENLKLERDIRDLFEARDKLEDAPRGAWRWIAEYATMRANSLFTEQQRKIFHDMMHLCNADYTASKYGISRCRVVETFSKCLRKIVKVMDLDSTQEKWDKLEQENMQLKLLNASLKQQINDLRATAASNPSLFSMSEGDQVNKILDTPLQDFNFTVKAKNVLNSIGCKTLGDVMCLTREKLMRVPHCGLVTVDNIEKVLKDNGYELGVDLNSLLQEKDME